MEDHSKYLRMKMTMPKKYYMRRSVSEEKLVVDREHKEKTMTEDKCLREGSPTLSSAGEEGLRGPS